MQISPKEYLIPQNLQSIYTKVKFPELSFLEHTVLCQTCHLYIELTNIVLKIERLESCLGRMCQSSTNVLHNTMCNRKCGIESVQK